MRSFYGNRAGVRGASRENPRRKGARRRPRRFRNLPRSSRGVSRAPVGDSFRPPVRGGGRRRFGGRDARGDSPEAVFGGFQASGGKALQGGGRGDFGADAPQNRGKAEAALTWVRTRFFCRTSARG